MRHSNSTSRARDISIQLVELETKNQGDLETPFKVSSKSVAIIVAKLQRKRRCEMSPRAMVEWLEAGAVKESNGGHADFQSKGLRRGQFRIILVNFWGAEN